jgi:hypothetical protein
MQDSNFKFSEAIRRWQRLYADGRGYTPTAALGVASTYADCFQPPRVAVGVYMTP